MIKILHVVSSLDGGGVERMIYNYFENFTNINFQFDFIVHDVKGGILENYFEEKGSKIFHVTPKKISIRKNYKEIKNVIKNGNYDIIHCHQNYMSFLPLIFAKKYKIPKRIVHSHAAPIDLSIKQKLIKKVLAKICIAKSNLYCACGSSAAKYLFGTKMYNQGKVTIVPNTINVNDFRFNEDLRIKLRNQYNFGSEKVVGLIGRLSQEKNHLFIIDTIEKIIKEENKVKLVLIGDGALKNKIEQYIIDKNMASHVLMLGKVNNVNELLNMLDVLVLPSHNEGFGIVLVEAQSNGLPCIASTNVPREVNVTNEVAFLDLNDNYNEWKNSILNAERNARNFDKIKKSIYNSRENNILEKLYKDNIR